MLAEFTAIYEPHPNGKYAGYIAEFPEVRTLARSLDEARSHLTEQLCAYLEGERGRSLAKATSQAHIEPLRLDTTLRRAGAGKNPTETPDVLPTLGKHLRIDPMPPRRGE